ncbi:hypothetical protein L9F63_009832 [Diploptera punctata]|uniref:Gustatory receptor n=1 Tax=Diploptera punctata TaxID=6984 RepID=A0AAD8AIT3_DIPPU|nr:hypothetical protein L9F63_009832 [Diploptera punctata]
MDIYQCIIPLHYASKIWGLTPFELIRQGNRDNEIKRLRNSVTGIFYSIFMCILITSNVLFVLISNFSHYLQTGYTANAATLVILYFSFSSSALCAVIGCVINRERLLILLEAIFEFETRFYGSNSKIISFNRFLKFEIFFTYITIILISIYDIWLWGIYYNVELSFFPYILILFIMATLTIQYTNIIYLSYDKFKLINLALVKYISKMYEVQSDGNKNNNMFTLPTSYNINNNNNNNNYYYQELRKKNFISKLRDIRRKHYALHNISDEVNKVFGFQILFFMLSFFISITNNIYYSLYFMLNESSEVRGSLLVTVEQLFWIMVMAVELIAITVVCHMTSGEAMRTGIVLRNVLLYEPLNTMLSTEIQVFLEQIQNRPLRYSACGLFNIDLTLLSSFIGAVATYVIVLIQMH